MTTRTNQENAVATAALAGNHGFSLISNEKLLQLYTSMLKCRMIEERVRTLGGQGRLGDSNHASTGQEAPAAGIAIDLLAGDTVVPSHRDLIVNFIKGDPLPEIIRSLFAGTATPPLAEQLDRAASAALTNKTARNGKIAVAFLSCESNSPDLWHDALLRAETKKLPILFVCQPSLSNGEQQTGIEEIGLDAQACGLPAITVDGGDVVAVYRVATEAITHARKGNGATLITCTNFHSDGPQEIDPILKMEAYLSRKGLFRAELKREVAGGFTMELDAAIQAPMAM